MRKRAKRMEDRQLPIFIEAFGKKGKIVKIHPKTKCLRIYEIVFEDGSSKFYRGASTRPSWIQHILKPPKLMKDETSVWAWLGLTKEEFDRISGKGVCVVCRKPTSCYANLCVGHKRAYRRWRNKKVAGNE